MDQTDIRPSQAGTAGTTPASAAVRLEQVRRSFGDVEAVRGIDLTVHPGEVVAFLGPNGAGKTTTIDMILGLSRPTSGSVSVLGMEPREAVARGLVAAVMQSGGLLKDLSVLETVQYVGSLFTTTQDAADVLERAGLTRIADRKVGRCSGGEQQRLRFALALLSDPQLLLLDEPTTGMDVEGRRGFWEAIREDAGRGRTIMFATHYLEEADAYADRIVLVSRGRIVANGTAAQIKAQVSGRTVRATCSDVGEETVAGITALAGVEGVEVRGHTVIVHAQDSDTVARHLLTRTDAHDLEIVVRGLEDAFVALTATDDDTTTDTSAAPDRAASSQTAGSLA